MKTSLFYLPGVGTRAHVEAGDAGLKGELYDAMLAEVLGQCQLGIVLPANNPRHSRRASV